jgi:hypothetical protein
MLFVAVGYLLVRLVGVLRVVVIPVVVALAADCTVRADRRRPAPARHEPVVGRRRWRRDQRQAKDRSSAVRPTAESCSSKEHRELRAAVLRDDSSGTLGDAQTLRGVQVSGRAAAATGTIAPPTGITPVLTADRHDVGCHRTEANTSGTDVQWCSTRTASPVFPQSSIAE